MDELQKRSASDSVPSTGSDEVKIAKSTQQVEKKEGNWRRDTEDQIKEWRLDNLLSPKPSLELTVDGSSSKIEGLDEEPESVNSASHRAQFAKAKSSNKMDFALIILNQAIDLELEVFMNLFIHCTFILLSNSDTPAQLVICADGGANYLSDFNFVTGHEFVSHFTSVNSNGRFLLWLLATLTVS